MKDQYYNMKEKIDPNMHVIDIVLRAMSQWRTTQSGTDTWQGTDGHN